MVKRILNKDIVELDFDSSEQLDKEEKIGNLILPFGATRDGLAKTITCKIKNLNPAVTKNYGLFIGDDVLVDRYAIIQVKARLEFLAYINVDSIIMVKKKECNVSGRPAKDRIVDYLEEAPKKCFFSCYNTMCRHESVAVAMKHSDLMKKIVKEWTDRPDQSETFEEFRTRVHNTEF